jgi:predicted molibdopterin-dependent oxidoreductase YjgC
VCSLYTKIAQVKKFIRMLIEQMQGLGDVEGSVQFIVDGRKVRCHSGQTIAGALLAHGIYTFRSSPNAAGARGPFCMMGACQECAIEIDGSIRRACQTEVRDGMIVGLHGAGMV